MPVTTTYIKKTTTTAVVKFVGDGTATVNLATDLLAAQQTLTGEPVKVHISGVLFSTQTTNNVKITRNSIDVLSLYGNGDWHIDGFSLTENEASNVTVNLGSGGSVILELKKVGGYTSGPVF